MAARAIGYAQAMDMLLDCLVNDPPSAGEGVPREWCVGRPALCGLVEVAAAATHNLVRSQLVWFRKESDVQWLDMAQLSGAKAAADHIMEACKQPQHTGYVPPDANRPDKGEQRELKQRRVVFPVFDSQPELVAHVLHHLNHSLLPRLAAHPALPAAIEARRAQVAAVSSLVAEGVAAGRQQRGKEKQEAVLKRQRVAAATLNQGKVQGQGAAAEGQVAKGRDEGQSVVEGQHDAAEGQRVGVADHGAAKGQGETAATEKQLPSCLTGSS